MYILLLFVFISILIIFFTINLYSFLVLKWYNDFYLYINKTCGKFTPELYTYRHNIYRLLYNKDDNNITYYKKLFFNTFYINIILLIVILISIFKDDINFNNNKIIFLIFFIIYVYIYFKINNLYSYIDNINILKNYDNVYTTLNALIKFKLENDPIITIDYNISDYKTQLKNEINIYNIIKNKLKDIEKLKASSEHAKANDILLSINPDDLDLYTIEESSVKKMKDDKYIKDHPFTSSQQNIINQRNIKIKNLEEIINNKDYTNLYINNEKFKELLTNLIVKYEKLGNKSDIDYKYNELYDNNDFIKYFILNNEYLNYLENYTNTNDDIKYYYSFYWNFLNMNNFYINTNKIITTPEYNSLNQIYYIINNDNTIKYFIFDKDDYNIKINTLYQIIENRENTKIVGDNDNKKYNIINKIYKKIKEDTKIDKLEYLFTDLNTILLSNDYTFKKIKNNITSYLSNYILLLIVYIYILIFGLHFIFILYYKYYIYILTILIFSIMILYEYYKKL